MGPLLLLVVMKIMDQRSSVYAPGERHSILTYPPLTSALVLGSKDTALPAAQHLHVGLWRSVDVSRHLPSFPQ